MGGDFCRGGPGHFAGSTIAASTRVLRFAQDDNAFLIQS